MAKAFPHERSAAQKIFDNIIFLGNVFGDRDDEEIPDIPVLELAKSFELRDSSKIGRLPLTYREDDRRGVQRGIPTTKT